MKFYLKNTVYGNFFFCNFHSWLLWGNRQTLKCVSCVTWNEEGERRKVVIHDNLNFDTTTPAFANYTRHVLPYFSLFLFSPSRSFSLFSLLFFDFLKVDKLSLWERGGRGRRKRRREGAELSGAVIYIWPLISFFFSPQLIPHCVFCYLPHTCNFFVLSSSLSHSFFSLSPSFSMKVSPPDLANFFSCSLHQVSTRAIFSSSSFFLPLSLSLIIAEPSSSVHHFHLFLPLSVYSFSLIFW